MAISGTPVTKPKDIPMALDPILLDLADLSPRPRISKSIKPVRFQNEKKKSIRRDSVVKEDHGALDAKNQGQKCTSKVIEAEKKERDRNTKEGIKTIKVLKPPEKIKRDELDGVENRTPKPVTGDPHEISSLKSMKNDREISKDESGSTFSNDNSDSIIKVMNDGKIMKADKNQINFSVNKAGEMKQAEMNLEIKKAADSDELERQVANVDSEDGVSFFY